MKEKRRNLCKLKVYNKEWLKKSKKCSRIKLGDFMKERVIFHIDVNNAFLSWTAVYLLENGYKKDIRKIPSIIGGDERARKGIVLAKSPVAKEYGIVTAETIYSAKKKCPYLEVYPSNYEWYQKKSQELMEYLSKYSPIQEQLSVDECFLEMTGMKYLHNDLEKLAYQIKKEIKEKFGYTVNIGIANNKLCAKMASDFEKPDKVHTLYQKEIAAKMWPLPIEDLYMVGKETAKILRSLRINTIGDLANTKIDYLKRYFKNQAEFLHNQANGIDNSLVEINREKNQSISTSTTLPYDYQDLKKLEEVLLEQAQEVGRKLRNKKLYANTIGILLKNNQFTSFQHQEKLSFSTNKTQDIYEIAKKLLEESWKNDSIRLIGIKLSGLEETRKNQISIFEEEQEAEREDKVQKIMDNINNKFGHTTVIPASMTKKQK